MLLYVRTAKRSLTNNQKQFDLLICSVIVAATAQETVCIYALRIQVAKSYLFSCTVVQTLRWCDIAIFNTKLMLRNSFICRFQWNSRLVFVISADNRLCLFTFISLVTCWIWSILCIKKHQACECYHHRSFEFFSVHIFMQIIQILFGKLFSFLLTHVNWKFFEALKIWGMMRHFWYA